uniref:Putative trypsin n=1 Tax=Amblyomma triste TaxID=251400 RepID=A0A023G588_AMBTT
MRSGLQLLALLLFLLKGARATQCGQRNLLYDTERIVGGSDAGPLEFPWQVSVQVFSSHQCGGVILDEYWILTAAHCMKYSPIFYKIYVGKDHLFRKELTERYYYVSEIIKHPYYSEDTVDYDIALIRLDEPMDFFFDDYLSPICMPKPSDDFTGQTCVITGWGYPRMDGSTTDVLQKTNLYVWKQEDCRKAYEDVNNVTDRMLCAGYDEGGRGPCKGDSGGPLQCLRSDGAWVLAGITSWGMSCAAPHRPGVFTRVSAVLDFVYLFYLLKSMGPRKKYIS